MSMHNAWHRVLVRIADQRHPGRQKIEEKLIETRPGGAELGAGLGEATP